MTEGPRGILLGEQRGPRGDSRTAGAQDPQGWRSDRALEPRARLSEW